METGLILMAYAMTYTVLGPLFGVLIDKGTKTLLLQGVPDILWGFFCNQLPPLLPGPCDCLQKESVAISFYFDDQSHLIAGQGGRHNGEIFQEKHFSVIPCMFILGREFKQL